MAYSTVDAANDAKKNGDRGYCGVVALSAITGLPYKECAELLAKHGRKWRCGTRTETLLAALKELGYEAKQIDPASIIERYPSPHDKLKHVTYHQVNERFPGVWEDILKEHPKMLLFSRRHVEGLTTEPNVRNHFPSDQRWVRQIYAIKERNNG